MAISRRRLMQGLLGTGAVVAGGGVAGLAWLDRRLDAETPAHPPAAAGAARPLPVTAACDDGDEEPTPSATEGPFYTPNTPRRTVLREAGIAGAPLVLEGRVLTPDCMPIAGAVLDFWHCDGNGVYDNEGFKLRGHQLTDGAGAWRLETVKPASYGQYGGQRTPHVHVRVQGPGTRRLTTQLFFPGEPLNARDGLFQEELLVQMARTAGGVLACRFDFVLA